MRLSSPSLLVALALSLAAAVHSRAQVTIGQSYGSGSVAGATSGSGYYWAEEFTAPTNGDDILTSLSLWYSTTGAGITSLNSVYAYNGSNAVGPALFTGSTALATGSLDAVTYSNLSINLTPGATYLFTGETTDSNYQTALYYNNNASANTSTFGSSSLGVVMYGGSSPTTENVALIGGTYLDFNATFTGAALTPVPEAKSFVWAGLALCVGLAFWQRRRSPSAVIQA